MLYDNNNPNHRALLATYLLRRLDEAGFAKNPDAKGAEEIYNRSVTGRIRVVVYTSVVGKQVRTVGADAIRVVALYHNKKGHDRPIVKATRKVYRTGAVQDIVDRTVERMREVWAAARKAERCSCGAPKGRSKRGGLYCLDTCWV